LFKFDSFKLLNVHERVFIKQSRVEPRAFRAYQQPYSHMLPSTIQLSLKSINNKTIYICNSHRRNSHKNQPSINARSQAFQNNTTLIIAGCS